MNIQYLGMLNQNNTEIRILHQDHRLESEKYLTYVCNPKSPQIKYVIEAFSTLKELLGNKNRRYHRNLEVRLQVSIWLHTLFTTTRNIDLENAVEFKVEE